MDLITSLIFLSSGLFLGWSLGANDASNVFGSAVGSRMVRFSTAAFICSLFVIIGAVTAGAGASNGLGELGAVNAIAGSFTTALAAALTVFWMTKASLPVSTTQAVVGAIIGWNWFSGSVTDLGQLSKIVGTWVICPIMAGLFSAALYPLVEGAIRWKHPHLLRLDSLVRLGLILAGVFGAYSLGANNIGNVMGVFVTSSPFSDLQLGGSIEFTGTQQLFLLGSIAIAVGVYTYSKRVMMTVGGSLMTLSPLGAFVVVVANSLVLFVFSSSELSSFVASLGLPPIPLIPVSSSQAVVGAVIGIGMLKGVKGARQIQWPVLGRIASGWVTTPLVAAVVGFTLLFVVQNVFNQQVYEPRWFQLTPAVVRELERQQVPIEGLMPQDAPVESALGFRKSLRETTKLPHAQETVVINTSELQPIAITAENLASMKEQQNARKRLSPELQQALQALEGERFPYPWQLEQALEGAGANQISDLERSWTLNHFRDKPPAGPGQTQLPPVNQS